MKKWYVGDRVGSDGEARTGNNVTIFEGLAEAEEDYKRRVNTLVASAVLELKKKNRDRPYITEVCFYEIEHKIILCGESDFRVFAPLGEVVEILKVMSTAIERGWIQEATMRRGWIASQFLGSVDSYDVDKLAKAVIESEKKAE